MQQNLNNYIKRKQRKRRFWTLLLLTFMMAVVAMLATECSQSFDQPYNKSYQPMDQIQKGTGQ